MTLELRIFLKHQNIDFNIPEQYIPDEKAKDMDNTTIYISENWHKDLFQFKGISLCQIVQWEFTYYLTSVIRNLITIKNMIDLENPNVIITFKDSDEYIQEFNFILSKICASKGIVLEIIPIEKSSLGVHKLKLNWKEKLLKKVKDIQNLKQFKLGLKYLTSLLWHFNKLKMIKRKKFSKNILMYGSFSYESIINELANKHKIIILNYLQSLPKFKQNIINTFSSRYLGFHKFFEDYRCKKNKKIAKSFIKHSLYKWKEIINDPNFQKIFTYDGVFLWPFVKKKVYKIILSDFKRICEDILTILTLLNKEKVDLITLNVDVIEFPKLIALIASKLKIHTLVLQHGITGHPIGFVPSYSEKFAVWGKISKDWLIHFGMPEEKIVITGCPRFDKYITMNQNKKLKEKIKRSIYKEFKIKKFKKLVVFTTNHSGFRYRFTSAHSSPYDVEKIYSNVLNTIKKLSDIYLIIKLHPGDPDMHIPKEMIKYLKIRNVSVVRTYNIKNLLISCDCVITTWSTTGIEAMLLDKPLICLKIKEDEFPVPYIKYKAAIGVSNLKNLGSAIQNILINPKALKKNQTKFLKDYIYKIDGLSTKRVHNLINNLISSENKT